MESWSHYKAWQFLTSLTHASSIPLSHGIRKQAECRQLLCAVGNTLWFAVPATPVEAAQAAVSEGEEEEQPEEPAEEEEQLEGPAEEEEQQPEGPAEEEEQPEGATEEEEQPEGPAEEEAQAVTSAPLKAPVHETAEDLPKVPSFCAQAELWMCITSAPVL